MQKNNYFFKGFGISLFIGVIIFICLKSGWYSRASMQANAEMSNLFLISTILIGAVLFGFLYNFLKNEKR